MKRRIFLTAAGMAGVGLGTGLAATGKALFSNAPWHVFPNLSSNDLNHLDSLASQMKQNLKSHSLDENLLVKTVAPKQVISQKSNLRGYQFIYKNKAGSFVIIEKKNGKTTTGIYNKIPKVA